MASKESTVQIRGFSGLNSHDDAAIIQDSELSELINFNVGRGGELISRTGVTQISSGSTLGSNSTIVLGQLVTDALSQLIVKAGDNVYYSTDGINYVLIGAYADAEWGLQYVGKFYIIRSGNLMVEWNGVAASNIASSPHGTFAIVHKDRMFVMNSLAGATSSRLYYSEAGDVSAAGWVSDNFVDVQPGDGDLLVAATIIQDLLVVFKGTSTWGLYIQGLEADWVLRNLNGEIGCISRHAIEFIEGWVYFSAAPGIYRSEGATFTRVSDAVNVEIDDRVVNTTTINTDSFGFWDDLLICLLAPTPSIRLYFVYNTKNGAWSEWEFSGGITPVTFHEVYTTTPERGLYMGDESASGRILRFGDEIYTDRGVAYDSSFATKQFDFGEPSIMKRGKWSSIDMVGLATITWSHEADNTEVINGNTSSQSNRAGVKIPGPGYFRTWKFIASFESNAIVTIIGLTLHIQAARSTIKALT